MSKNTPVASYSLTVRLRIANQPGMLGKVTSAIGEAGGDIGGVDLVEAGSKEMTRDIGFKASDEAHGQAIVERLRGVAGVTVVNVDALAQGRTTITIAHRLSTIRDADQIVVLDHGRIIEAGDHASLMASQGRYAELAA